MTNELKLFEKSTNPLYYDIMIGFTQIFDGLVCIITLGLYRSRLTLFCALQYGKGDRRGKLKLKL